MHTKPFSRVWGTLNAALESEREFLAGKSQLEEDVKEWQKAALDKKAGALLTGNRLARAQGWLLQRPQDLAVDERHYIKDSFNRETSRRRRRLRAAALAFLSVSLFAVFAVLEWRKASEQASRAERATVLALQSTNKLIERVKGYFANNAVSSEVTKELLTTSEEAINALVKLDNTRNMNKSIAELLVLFSDVHSNLGNTNDSLQSAMKAKEIAVRELTTNPTDPALIYLKYSSLFRIGDALMLQILNQNKGQTYLEEAFVIAGEEVRKAPQDDSWQRELAFMESKIGDTFFMGSKLTEALSHYNRSLDIYKALRAKLPNNLEVQRDLASAHARIGDALSSSDKRAALAKYREALSLREAVEKASPENEIILSNLANNHTQIARILTAIGDTEAAMTEHRLSLQIREKLAAKDPTNGLSKSQLAYGYYYLANALRDNREFDAALGYYQSAVALRTELVKRGKTNFSWKLNLARTHRSHAETLVLVGSRDDALKAYRAAIAVFEQLRTERPASDARRKDVFATRLSIGDLLLELKAPAEAIEEFHKALAIAEQMAKEDSKSGEGLYNLWNAEAKLGQTLKAQNQQREALDEFEKALPVIESLIARDPANEEWQRAREVTKTWALEVSQSR